MQAVFPRRRFVSGVVYDVSQEERRVCYLILLGATTTSNPINSAEDSDVEEKRVKASRTDRKAPVTRDTKDEICSVLSFGNWAR
jgi:hypothetical protein